MCFKNYQLLVKNRMQRSHLTLQHFRERLAYYDALPQLVILGLLSGILVGLMMVLFRLAIDLPLSYWLPHPDDFESLPANQAFWWPVIGSFILLVLFYLWPVQARKVGIVNLLERLSYHQGIILGRNMLVQFVTATIALISGHSVGREGPAIYLGAACSSLLGQRLRLPNNSMRLLIGCGSAAAISAAFNTPLAGVIFAMEVILLEYTLIGFTPVIVAAVSADLVMRSILGHNSVFSVPLFEIGSLAEVPWIMLMGVTIGLCAALFCHIMRQTYKLLSWPLGVRFMLAGVLTGAVAMVYPQVMGVGYDTISDAFWGRIEWQLLCGLLIAKLLLTPFILGLGIPAGLIGPTLFIGALVGGIFGVIGDWFTEMAISHAGLYSMLGMGAMMAAVLNAPLAALVALLEMTGNPNIILPGMITIVISNLTVRHLFNMPSIFQMSLQAQGLDYRQEPIAQALSRAAAGSLMERRFVTTPQLINTTSVSTLLNETPRWILVMDPENKPRYLMPSGDLQDYLSRMESDEATDIDLFEMPADRASIVQISFRATLYEALQYMNEQHVNTLCVVSNQGDVMGVLTRSQIEYYYSHKQTL